MHALALLACLLAAPGHAQSDEAARLQQALDQLALAETLLDGRMSAAARDQALAQIRAARDEIRAAQAALLRQAPPPLLPGIALQIQIPVEPPPPPPVAEPVPASAPAGLDAAGFAALRAAIQGESFGDGKLRVLREALRGHPLTVQQASGLLPLFDFSSDRIEAAVAIHPVLLDPQDFYRLYACFDFESDKEELRRRLGL